MNQALQLQDPGALGLPHVSPGQGLALGIHAQPVHPICRGPAAVSCSGCSGSDPVFHGVNAASFCKSSPPATSSRCARAATCGPRAGSCPGGPCAASAPHLQRLQLWQTNDFMKCCVVASSHAVLWSVGGWDCHMWILRVSPWGSTRSQCTPSAEAQLLSAAQPPVGQHHISLCSG